MCKRPGGKEAGIQPAYQSDQKVGQFKVSACLSNKSERSFNLLRVWENKNRAAQGAEKEWGMSDQDTLDALHETLVDLRELTDNQINSPRAFNQIIAALSYIEDQLQILTPAR